MICDLMVPTRIGPQIERRDMARGSSTAFAGTGFDPECSWHFGAGIGPWPAGGDGLRYAIAIQQARDDGDWPLADKRRAFATRMGFRVECGKDFTTLWGPEYRTENGVEYGM